MQTTRARATAAGSRGTRCGIAACAGRDRPRSSDAEVVDRRGVHSQRRTVSASSDPIRIGLDRGVVRDPGGEDVAEPRRGITRSGDRAASDESSPRSRVELPNEPLLDARPVVRRVLRPSLYGDPSDDHEHQQGDERIRRETPPCTRRPERCRRLDSGKRPRRLWFMSGHIEHDRSDRALCTAAFHAKKQWRPLPLCARSG